MDFWDAHGSPYAMRTSDLGERLQFGTTRAGLLAMRQIGAESANFVLLSIVRRSVEVLSCIWIECLRWGYCRVIEVTCR